MVRLSAFIITLNEENDITRCLESLLPVADEIVVVDSFSTDKTVELARAMGAKVLQRPFTGYGDQKLFALQQTQHDWVLSLDADEALSPLLQKSLLAFKSRPQHHVYEVNRLSSYCGKWIRHCGWYPQYLLRLWNKNFATISNSTIHETVVLKANAGKPGRLRGDLLHYTYSSISEHLRRMEHYSELSAREQVAKGKSCGLFKIIFVPKWVFFVSFILQGGFLDGYYGYVLCKNSAFAAFVKYTKIRQYHALRRKGIHF